MIAHDRRRAKHTTISSYLQPGDALVDPRSKGLGSALGPFALCIYSPGTVAIILVDGGC